MPNLSRENIEWAVKAYRDGRRMDFIASILEVKPSKVRSIVMKEMNSWRAETGSSAARKKAEALFSPAGGCAPENSRQSARIYEKETPASSNRDRRKFMLASRYARHWDMIWFLTKRQMSGRSLRKI